MISKAPAKPTKTALHRRRPTCSPSSGTDIAVTNSGEVKPIAEAVARGTRPIAITNTRLLTSINSDRPSWIAGRRVANRRRPWRGKNTASMTIRCPVKRAQTICMTG